jgi:hypothetical protein
MLRNEWEFEYKASEILKAAQAKCEYHDARLKWWTAKKEEKLTKLKEEGVNVDQSVVFEETYGANPKAFVSNTYARQPSVKLDETLVKDLNECISKCQDHRQKANAYQGWCAILAKHGDKALQLQADDWHHFFGTEALVERGH